jgi:uncharacterized protein YlxP (DUF503 family)
VIIGVRSWELHVPEAHSLKEKRSVVKSMKDRLRNAFNVSVAETGRHEAWQVAEITVCLVASDRRHAESVLAAADRFVAGNARCRIVDSVTSYF